jgi:hypothetical protein
VYRCCGQIEPTYLQTVKDFKTLFSPDIAAANVCTMKKTRGLYHVPETRYFNFSHGRFFGYTYRAGCMLGLIKKLNYHYLL